MKTVAKEDVNPAGAEDMLTTTRVTYGSGKFIFPNGAVYAGEWAIVEPVDSSPLAADDVDGMVNSSNTVVPDTNTISPDDVEADVLNSLRVVTEKDRYFQTERGQVCAGIKQRHGFGRYQHGPELYMGSWMHDVMHGRGRFESDVGCYEGEFVNGRFHGRGSYQWPSGAWYAGEWVNNKMHGHGMFVSAEGHAWEGVFHNDYFITREGEWLLPCAQQQQVWANPNNSLGIPEDDEDWEYGDADADDE